METETRGATRLSDAVAKEVRVLLVRRDMKQTDLAAKMGVSEMWLSRRLRGSQPIDLNDLQLIADALNVEATDLLPRSDEGRTVVFADGARRQTTVPYLSRTVQPHPVGQRHHTHHAPGTRRTVRLSQARA